MPDLNLQLKFAILQSGKTQRTVALNTRIPETRLSAIVRGRHTPTKVERQRLARVLGVAAHELFGITDRAVA